MKLLHGRRKFPLALLMLTALLIGSVSPLSFAHAADTPLAARTTVQPTGVVGAIAAIGCGLGARFWPIVVAGGPGMIAAEIGLCALMLLDAAGTHDA